MSDSRDPDFDRSLFVRVRREGPSEALRQRILVQGRAELERIGRTPARSGTVRLRRAPFAGLLACAAVLAGFLWLRGRTEEHIEISAENTAPRSAEPQVPSPVPAPELPSAPRQNAATHAPTAPRGAAARGASASRKAADAGATLAAPPALEAPLTPPPAASLAEQIDQIKRVRTALRAGQSEQALLLLDEYQSGRGGTELAAEARLLRIEALASAGRKSEAASEARRFATDFPTSPLIDRAQSFARP